MVVPDTTSPLTPPPNVEWHAFDYANKGETAPPQELDYELVWIIETIYSNGVDLGYYDGHTFRTRNGSDDCSVSYWAEITYPEPPEGWDADGDEEAAE